MPKAKSRHGAPWTRKDSVQIRKLIREGLPTRKIASKLGRTIGALYMRASVEGISLGGSSRTRSKR